MTTTKGAEIVRSLLQAPNVIGASDFVTLPNGIRWPKPSEEDRRKAAEITREQERLYNELGRLRPNASEEQSGKYLSICRKVGDLEIQKHPLLRVYNEHLWTDEAKRRKIIL